MSGEGNVPGWMGGEPDLGETFVQGKDRATARALLDAAAALELDPSVVRAVTNGFIVPNPVYDRVLAEHAGTDTEF